MRWARVLLLALVFVAPVFAAQPAGVSALGSVGRAPEEPASSLASRGASSAATRPGSGVGTSATAQHEGAQGDAGSLARFLRRLQQSGGADSWSSAPECAGERMAAAAARSRAQHTGWVLLGWVLLCAARHVRVMPTQARRCR